MTEITPHLGYVYCALMGCVVGAAVAGFVIAYIEKEENMACKAHGNCIQCDVADLEDMVNQLDAKYGPLWEVLQDVEPKLAQMRAHMKNYTDDQMRRVEARALAQSMEINSMQDKLTTIAALLPRAK